MKKVVLAEIFKEIREKWGGVKYPPPLKMR
jgi:hypothetical protein